MSKSAKPRSAHNDLTPHAARLPMSGAQHALGVRGAGYLSHVAEILQGSAQPIPMDELVQRVSALNLDQGAVQNLVQEAVNTLYQAVVMPSGEVGWLTNLLQDNCIRHPLTEHEAERGFMLMDELEHACFFPEFFQTHQAGERRLQIELFGDATISAEAYIERKTWSLHLGEPFVRWIEQQGGDEGDDILIRVIDAAAGRYLLRLHPREARENSKIHNRNIHTALTAEDLVRQQQHVRSGIPTWDLAALLVGHGVYAADIPPDDLHCVLHQYSLLKYNGTGYMVDLPGSASKETGLSGDEEIFPPSDAADSVYDVPAVDFEPTDSARNGYLSELDDADLFGYAPGIERRAESFDTDPDAYQAYLDRLYQAGADRQPLTPNEFAMLKAELDALTELQDRFGYLLREQQRRQFELYTGLLMDVEQDTNTDDDFWGDDDGYFDAPDRDEPTDWGK